MTGTATKALWTAEEAAAATGGRASGGWAAARVSIDSRGVSPGDLFVALEGPNRDGHAFVADALAKGAAACVCARVPEGVEDDGRLLLVGDTFRALHDLGAAGRERFTGRIVGVTGSVGKTGTKEALRHVLSRFGTTQASAASHNNHWGVPLTLANFIPDAAFGVVEMGMNHAGEIRELTRLARPDAALVTAIAPAHLEQLGSLENIARAKAEIFEGLTPGGTAVINADTPHVDTLVEAARARGVRVLTYGENEVAGARPGVRLAAAKAGADGTRLALEVDNKLVEFYLDVPGAHWVANASGVLAVCAALGLDVPAAAEALKGFAPGAGRGLRRRLNLAGGEILLLDESYNANPASVAAALSVLAGQTGRRVAVLGDMLELGPSASALHAGLARAVTAAGVAVVHTCGALSRNLHDALPPALRGEHAATSSELAPKVVEGLRAGDAVLVKGSLGSRMREVVDALDAASTPDNPAAGAPKPASGNAVA